MDGKRQKRRSFDGEGHIHSLTFSTYRRQAFLLEDEFRRAFLDNLKTAKEIRNQIEYIHLNPVRRGLAERAEDWPWSSARFYKEIASYEFEVDRCEEWLP